MECELLVPYSAEMYVRALLSNHERLFKTMHSSSWGVARNADCGHYKVFVQIGDQRQMMKPCFFTEERATHWCEDMAKVFQDLMGREGRHSTRINLN